MRKNLKSAEAILVDVEALTESLTRTQSLPRAKPSVTHSYLNYMSRHTVCQRSPPFLAAGSFYDALALRRKLAPETILSRR